MSSRIFKSKHPTPQQTQTQTSENISVQIPANEKEEELHYGDVNFLQRRPEAFTLPAQHSGQQEMAYSQIKVSDAPPEDLYDQVKKT
ncbi:hypothetical protein AMECASPLE_037135 [Ameca splendens]|uniref:Uncharacterized protein n=1 Tax=Ameca splendens TaxID=208324 RepID=A0ABV0Z5R9_9TELE